jgi:hypothetical protein
MALQPPQYRADAPIVFVHESDGAWDRARIIAEREKMLERGIDPKYHPVSRYLGGWTRYNLDAPATLFDEATTARAYLIESERPTLWKLRRLGREDWYEVQPMWEASRARGEPRPMKCYQRCCELGLVGVENGPALELPGGRPNRSDLDRLFAIGHDMPFDIGCAVYQASMPLDVAGAEGKPSG